MLLRRVPIRRKLMFISAGSVLVVSAVIGVMAVFFHTHVLNQQIKDAGTNMAYALEISVKEPLLANDVVGVKNISTAFAKPFYVLMDAIYKGDGTLAAVSPENKAALKLLDPAFKKLMLEPGDVHVVKLSLSQPLKVKGLSYSSVFVLHRKIYAGRLGHIFIVMPTAFEAVVKTQKKMVMFTNLISLLFIVIALVLITVVGRDIATRLEYLRGRAESISLGELDVSIDYVEDGDEIDALAEALERMRISLKAAIDRLRKRK